MMSGIAFCPGQSESW